MNSAELKALRQENSDAYLNEVALHLDVSTKVSVRLMLALCFDII